MAGCHDSFDVDLAGEILRHRCSIVVGISVQRRFDIRLSLVLFFFLFFHVICAAICTRTRTVTKQPGLILYM